MAAKCNGKDEQQYIEKKDDDDDVKNLKSIKTNENRINII